MSGKRLFVIDTDAGLDDAQAILMALAQSDVEVIAITTVHGNTSATQVALNVLRLLKVADKLDVPVYKGTEKPLVGKKGDSSFYHGKDGFGDVPDPDAPDFSLVQSEHAVNTLIRLVTDYPNQLTLVALGPLTNIALALRLDPDFGHKLKDCYIMGGNMEGKGNVTQSAEFNFHTDPEAANIVLQELGCPITLACWELCLKYAFSWEWYDTLVNSPTAKASFIKRLEAKTLEKYYNEQKLPYRHADQFAVAFAINKNVIQETSQVYCVVECEGHFTRGQAVVDWNNELQCSPNVSLVTGIDHETYGQMIQEMIICQQSIRPMGLLSLIDDGTLDTATDAYYDMRSVKTEKSKFLQKLEEHMLKNWRLQAKRDYVPCDELAMAIAISQDVLTKSYKHYVVVETVGHRTRGQMVIDWKGHLHKEPQVTIARSLDRKSYKKLLHQALS